MTLLEHLQKWEEEHGEIDRGNPVAVTCLLYGRGEIIYITPGAVWPIDAKFGQYYAVYSEYGQLIHKRINPSLALGHYDSQLECAKAIKEQNFDME